MGSCPVKSMTNIACHLGPAIVLLAGVSHRLRSQVSDGAWARRIGQLRRKHGISRYNDNSVSRASCSSSLVEGRQTWHYVHLRKSPLLGCGPPSSSSSHPSRPGAGHDTCGQLLSSTRDWLSMFHKRRDSTQQTSVHPTKHVET